MKITKEQNNAALVRLAELFPKTFTLEKHLAHRPLKIGIAADIRERCPDLGPHALAVALSTYANRIMYLQSLVPGAARVDLDGNACGEVTGSEAGHAVGVLAGIMARREAQRMAAAVPAKASPPLAPPAGAAGKGLQHKPVLHLRLGTPRR